MYYRIQSTTGLYLSVDNNNLDGGLIINNLFNDPSQYWTPVEFITGSNNKGFALLNVKTQKVVCSRASNQPVTQVSPTGMSGSSATWNAVGNAIQLNANTDQNLNVAGNNNYVAGTPVLSWSWSGGEPNETWKWIPVDFQP